MPKLSPHFMGLPAEETQYKNSPVVIIPVPWEKTTSYMKGTGKGPQAIIAASHQVEFYDAELKKENWKPGIHTFSPVDFGASDSKKALEAIEKTVGQVLDDHKFPIALGGEHTLTAGCVAAAAKRYPNLSILQIDAHADLRESYDGTPYSHASAMRLCLKSVKKLVGVGIRSVCVEEVEFAKQHSGVTLIYDHEKQTDPNWVTKALQGLTDDVYLTIDVDGFEPNLIPATGTPEPGGLTWYEGLKLIRSVFQKKNVVAADVVELLPLASQHASDFIAAKLVYKLIGYRQESRLQ
ncbi:MAG: agmatinase [Deltaproteobacteria bacterium RIFCSPLOWO2_02_FULL_46_8]|nr:MAG: agmatinase [Deltaproteobacteria bacterium RIFCSPLOWO2_02_FULL_46_8]